MCPAVAQGVLGSCFFYSLHVKIIAGEFRGRHIAPPPDQTTRPMLARVREALFNTLARDVPEAHILDLFAGTGSLGLEALSRGAAQVCFYESERRALALLRKNIEMLQVGERARIQAGNAFDRRRWGFGRGQLADLIFLDPPYPRLRDAEQKREVLEACEALFNEYLAEGGALVLHTHPRDLDAQDFPAGLTPEKRVYGNTALFYLRRESEPDADDE